MPAPRLTRMILRFWKIFTDNGTNARYSAYFLLFDMYNATLRTITRTGYKMSITTTTITGSPALSDVIKRTRRAQGLTQEALAENAGVSLRFMTDLEKDAGKCSLHNILAVTEELGIELQAVTHD